MGSQPVSATGQLERGTVIRNARMGFLCPAPNALNPFCVFGVDSDSATNALDPTVCYGGGPNIDQAKCVAANNAAAAALAVTDPAGAQDLEDAEGNGLGLLNPFTGSGPLASAGSVPGWLWIAGAGLALTAAVVVTAR